MDKRIIEFLKSGVCEGLYTVTVKEYSECDECEECDEYDECEECEECEEYDECEECEEYDEYEECDEYDEYDEYEECDEYDECDECEECEEMTSGGVSVGEVWGALSLDERLAFLDGCERVLGRNYLEVENLDFETVSSVLRADEMVRGLCGYKVKDGDGSALSLPDYDRCVVVIGNGKYFEDTMRRIAIYNGIYYEINARIFGVVNAKGEG